MQISIIIVNYQTFSLTKNCIDSVLKALEYGNLDGEVIVIDNNSPDNSGEKLKEVYDELDNVEIILNDTNAGFSVANNIGLRRAKGAYLLLLNSDTLIDEDTLKKAIDFLSENPKYGALGCKVILPDGKLDVACKRSFPTPLSALFHFIKLDKLFPSVPLFSSYNLSYLDEDEIHEVDCLMGAFLCISREVYETVGGLDEDFFMYGEDTDWCYRIKQAGYKLIYYPKTTIVHFKKASWNGKKNPKILNSFYDSMLLFYDKHYQDEYSKLTKGIVSLGVKSFKSIDRLRNSLKN